MKFLNSSIALLVLVLFFSSCDKDNDPIPPPNPPPVAQAVLSVKLGATYLVANQIDSAFAEWSTGSQKQRIKLEQRNDSLLAAMSQFNEGNGELTIHIFSNKKYRNQYLGQFVSHKTVSLQKTKSLDYKGPASFEDIDWSPWVVLTDGVGHEAVIALRPDDPYFFVKDPGHTLYKLTIERSYWKTTGGPQLIGQGIWECTTNCINKPNKEFFSNLPAKIGTKPWNHISIFVLYEIDNSGGGWGLNLEHEPWGTF